MTDDIWQGVPEKYEAEWRESFDLSRGCGVEIDGQCPICGAEELRRFFGESMGDKCVFGGRRFAGRGALWEWCSNCRTYEHSSALVPTCWNRPAIELNEFYLTPEPAKLDDSIDRWLRNVSDENARNISRDFTVREQPALFLTDGIPLEGTLREIRD